MKKFNNYLRKTGLYPIFYPALVGLIVIILMEFILK